MDLLCCLVVKSRNTKLIGGLVKKNSFYCNIGRRESETYRRPTE